MTIRPADLRAVPLFREMSEAELTRLASIFDREHVAAGETIFTTGSLPQKFVLLMRGDVALAPGPAAADVGPGAVDPSFRLRAITPLGELGALTGLPRSADATAITDVELWTVEVFTLLGFFDAHPDVAHPLYRSLVKILADKIRRDRRRHAELRGTQDHVRETVSRVRDLLLSGADPLGEASMLLDGLLDERKRRMHFRVAPTSALPSAVRFPDGTTLPLLDISDTHVKFVSAQGAFTRGTSCAFTLLLPGVELATGGLIERIANDGAVVKLDAMPEAQRALLDDYTTRLRLLDFVL